MLNTEYIIQVYTSVLPKQWDRSPFQNRFKFLWPTQLNHSILNTNTSEDRIQFNITEAGVQTLVVNFFVCIDPTVKAQNLVNGMPLAFTYLASSAHTLRTR